MIRLEDVSTVKMLENYPSSGILDCVNDEIARALASYYIKDYQQLEDFISSGNQYYNIDFFKNWLDLIKKNIEQANQDGVKTTQFTFNVATRAGVDSKELRNSDRKTFCRNLIINNPILGPSEQVSTIRNLRIFDAKLLLSKVVAHDIKNVGENAFLATYPTFSCEEILKLVSAINFYEQQIVRQSQELHQSGTNLFRLNKQYKEMIIRDKINAIIRYFINNADECVWGLVTQIQKEKLISAVGKRKNQEDKLLIERMVYMISNYTTLSEIESGIKPKTLNRFIVK